MLSTLLALLVTLGVLIAVHEYGHYKVARLCGVRVLRFSLGFGRVLWRRPISAEGGEFTLSAVPLGGYVRMLDSREAPVAPDMLSQAFDQQPLRSRVAIVAAGPLANLLLAVLLYAAASWWGSQEVKAVIGSPVAGSLLEQARLQSGDWVQAASRGEQDWQPVVSMADLRWQLTQAALDAEDLNLRVTDREGRHQRELRVPLRQLAGQEFGDTSLRKIGLSGPFSEPVLGDVLPGGAAREAGLRPGDKVMSLDGQQVSDAAQVREAVRAFPASGHSQMLWQIQREGQVIEVPVTPKAVPDGERIIGRIEAIVGQGPEMVWRQRGLIEGLAHGFQQTTDMAWLSLRMVGRMVVGEASIRQISGPITIAEGAGQSARLGVAQFLGFLAVVSVSLGVLNLLPLPMLDGGHLIYYLYEGLTGRPVSERWLERLQRGGVVVLMLLTFIALSNDVARLLGTP